MSLASAQTDFGMGDFTISPTLIPKAFDSSWYDDIDFDSWTVTNVNATDCADGAAGQDSAVLQSAIDAAAANTILQLEGGGCVYDIGTGASEIDFVKNFIVVKGAGRTQTIFDDGRFLVGVAGCTTCPTGSLTVSSPPSRGDTTFVVTDPGNNVTVGEWVWVESAAPAESTGSNDALKYGAEVVSKVLVSGDDYTVTIDRGFPHDYEATGLFAAYQNNAIEMLGIEDVSFQLNGGDEFAFLGGVNNFWAVNITISEGNQSVHHNSDGYVLRALFRSVIAKELDRPHVGANLHGAIYIGNNTGWADAIVENSVCDGGTPICVQMEDGAARTYVGYNYQIDPGPKNGFPASCSLCYDLGNPPYDSTCGAAGGSSGRSIMHHGDWNREIIAEGNDMWCAVSVGDNFFGNQGPHNTYYRNRLRYDGTDTDYTGRISPEDDDNDDSNYLANHVHRLHGKGGRAANEASQFLWWERNLYRDICRLDQDPADRETTDCLDGSSPFIPSTEMDWVTNFNGNDAPAGWSTFNGPVSLIYSSKPSWWCNEACAWDLQTGIGAFGDDFGGTLCKIPAQILQEGGTCTLSAAAPRTSAGGSLEGASTQ